VGKSGKRVKWKRKRKNCEKRNRGKKGNREKQKKGKRKNGKIGCSDKLLREHVPVKS
jgi:hypothetical protein